MRASFFFSIFPDWYVFYSIQLWSVTSLRYCFFDNRGAMNAMIITRFALFEPTKNRTRRVFLRGVRATRVENPNMRGWKRKIGTFVHGHTAERDYVHQGKYRFVVKYRQFRPRYIFCLSPSLFFPLILPLCKCTHSSKLRDLDFWTDRVWFAWTEYSCSRNKRWIN